MEQPFFSIIVPVYNVQDYLEECINSVLSQNFADYEIILVDDGSKDNSGKICDKFAKLYPEKIRVIHKENQGLLFGRHTGFCEAKGKYILNLDSDDFFLENLMCDVYKVIINTSADMVLYGYSKIFANQKVDVDNREVLELCEEICIKEIQPDIILTDNYNAVWAKCIKRELIDYNADYSGLEGLNQSEDRFVSLVYFDCANKVVKINKSLYGYRIRENSLTRAWTLKRYKDVRIVDARAKQYAQKWGVPFAQYIIKCLADAYNMLESAAFSRDKDVLKEAFDYILTDEFLKVNVESDIYKKMPKRYRFINKLLINKRFQSINIYFKTLIVLRKIKRKIFN